MISVAVQILGIRADNIPYFYISILDTIFFVDHKSSEYSKRFLILWTDFGKKGENYSREDIILRNGNCLVPHCIFSFLQVMARGTFSHSKLKNVMKGLTKIGPFTIHHPSGVSTTIFDASVKYKDDQIPLVVIAGSNFGRGSARDWATKGPYLLGKHFLTASWLSSFCFDRNLLLSFLLMRD